jgi:hypothetical protein
MTAADVATVVLSGLGGTGLIAGIAAAVLAADALGCRRRARRVRKDGRSRDETA